MRDFNIENIKGELSASPFILSSKRWIQGSYFPSFPTRYKRKNMSKINNKHRAANNWQLYHKAQKLPRKRPKPFTYVKRRFGNYKPLDWLISNPEFYLLNVHDLNYTGGDLLWITK